MLLRILPHPVPNMVVSTFVPSMNGAICSCCMYIDHLILWVERAGRAGLELGKGFWNDSRGPDAVPLVWPPTSFGDGLTE